MHVCISRIISAAEIIWRWKYRSVKYKDWPCNPYFSYVTESVFFDIFEIWFWNLKTKKKRLKTTVLGKIFRGFFHFGIVYFHRKWNGTRLLLPGNECTKELSRDLKLRISGKRKSLKCLTLKVSAHQTTQNENFDSFTRNCNKLRLRYFTEKHILLNYESLSTFLRPRSCLGIAEILAHVRAKVIKSKICDIFCNALETEQTIFKNILR